MEILKSLTGEGLKQHALTGPAFSRGLPETSRGPFQSAFFYVKPAVQAQNVSFSTSPDALSLIPKPTCKTPGFLLPLDKEVNTTSFSPTRSELITISAKKRLLLQVRHEKPPAPRGSLCSLGLLPSLS